jgi:hypothetical protein
MYQSLAETLYAIMNVKVQVAAIALVLTSFASLFIKNATDSFGFAALFAPALTFGCLVGVYGCKTAGITFSTSPDANIIATAGAGMVLAFLTMLTLVRIGGSVRDIARPVDLGGRAQELD